MWFVLNTEANLYQQAVRKNMRFYTLSKQEWCIVFGVLCFPMQTVILVLLGVIVLCVKLNVMLEFTLQMKITCRSFMRSPSVMTFHKSGLLVGPGPKKKKKKPNLWVNQQKENHHTISSKSTIQYQSGQIHRFSKSFHHCKFAFEVFLALDCGVINEAAHTVAVELNVVLSLNSLNSANFL